MAEFEQAVRAGTPHPALYLTFTIATFDSRLSEYAAQSEVQRLVCAYVPDRDSLVDALIAERREKAKFDYQRFMANDSILHEERPVACGLLLLGRY